jgi:hypothetical protein
MTEIDAHHGPIKYPTLYVDDTGGLTDDRSFSSTTGLSRAKPGRTRPRMREGGVPGGHLRSPRVWPKGSPMNGYTYDTLIENLQTLLTELDLSDVTLIGFSTGGGECYQSYHVG